MCGILGIVNLDGRVFGQSDRRFGERILGTMANRGPDDNGLFVRDAVMLGHHRLAIRDQDHGKQPWLSPDRNCALVYNGELYNDQELRNELSANFQFRSNCDTEVVMAAYQVWGRDCVQRFRGMFAFGLYDFHERSLWLVRDRFGIKPLFFTQVGERFVFASQVASIVAYPEFDKQPDWDTVSHYLSTTRLTLGSQTLYQGLRQLQPAEELVLRGQQLRVQRYWEYPHEQVEIGYEDAVDRLEHELNQAVKIRLTSDVPVGLFLSGGVDSSTLASLVVRNDSASRYATCATTEADRADITPEKQELMFAQACARQVGASLEPVHVDSHRYLTCWRDLVADFRLPLSTPSDVMIYEIARAAKKHVGVVIGGEGSDELLCGYEIAHWAGNDFDATHGTNWGHVPMSLLRSIERQYGRTVFTNEADHYFCINSLMPTGVKSHVLNADIWSSIDNDVTMFDYYQTMFDTYDSLSTVAKNAIVLHRVNLEALLSRLDSTTMHAGLEARVPFTDHVLVESMFRVPFSYRIDLAHQAEAPLLASAELSAKGRLRSKRILRTLANRLLPSDLANRRKASFPTGVQRWLQADWSQRVASYFASSPFATFLLSESFRTELVKKPQAAGMWLWPLTNLSMWGDAEFFGSQPNF